MKKRAMQVFDSNLAKSIERLELSLCAVIGLLVPCVAACLLVF